MNANRVTTDSSAASQVDCYSWMPRKCFLQQAVEVFKEKERIFSHPNTKYIPSLDFVVKCLKIPESNLIKYSSGFLCNNKFIDRLFCFFLIYHVIF